MTLRHMRIFVAVCQSESITRAAEALHLAQPSVSLAVRELEDYYGVRLFDRMNRRLHTTESGRKFYEYAVHIVSLFDELEKSIRDWDALSSLRIGSSVTIGSFLLPAAVRQFKAEHPDISVTVSIKNSAMIERDILDNRIDFALIEGFSGDPQIVQVPFMDDRLCLICGPGHPLCEKGRVPLSALTGCSFLLRESGSAGRDIWESILTARQLHITPAWESVSTQAIIRAVRQGIGISVLPYLLVRQELENGTVKEIEIEDVSLSRKFSFIYHRNKYLTRSALAFMQLCRENTGQENGPDRQER